MEKEEITFSCFAYKDLQPLEWLQYIAEEFMSVADGWDEWDSNSFEEEFEYSKEECPDISKKEIYSCSMGTVGDGAFHISFRHCTSFYEEVEDLRETILKAFGNSVIFPNILSAIGVMESERRLIDYYTESFWYYLYYSAAPTPEDAVKWYGESTAKRYKKNPELTEDDYENAFGELIEFIERIEKGHFSQKLRESAWAIQGYCKLIVGSEKYAETEEMIKKQKSELEKETFSTPLSQTAWADILHVSENTIRQWRRSTKKNRSYHFNEVSPRRWRLPINELPAEYLENYSKHLENIGIQKAKKHKNSK